ncbi:MAG TPA: hypothetical protein VML19_28355 [Verrucomicrobiae bacterium]|nr:hypothetical protein [Verrucomicrobiae bacterium]
MRTSKPNPRYVSRRGSALLAVMWLSAALAAIAFSLALTVRGETDRASTSVDSLRAYYLARGAVERAALELFWSIGIPDNPPVPPNSISIRYHFDSGDALVEFIPETAKIDLNSAPPAALDRLLLALNVDPARAAEIASAIADWRAPAPDGGPFDGYYLSQKPPFVPVHQPFQETEELLQVKGMTPEIYYGGFSAPSGSPDVSESLNSDHVLVRQPGLADCVTVYGSGGMVDVNTASPATLAAIGVPAPVIAMILQRRQTAPFTQQALADFIGATGISGAPLRVGGISIVTIRATGRLRLPNGKLSDLRRTVAAQIKYLNPKEGAGFHILRWYDTAWSE